MIRFADYTLEDQLKKLWKDAFSDPDEFIKLYFNQKYKPHKTLVEIEDETVLSVLQMLDYNMSFYGYDVKTSYISGAATLKNQRGNGLMRRLLNKSFEIMYNKQQLFSILIPGEQWLYGFYAKFGYAKCFYLDKQVKKSSEIQKENTDIIIKNYGSTDFTRVTNFYINYFKNLDFTVKKTAIDLKTVIDDHILGGGNIFLAYYKDKLEGICFAIKNKNDSSCLIKEILFKSYDVKNILIKHSACFFECTDICINQKASQQKFISELAESGMVRIINVYLALKLFASENKDVEECFNVYDNVLKINSGSYNIKNGICTKTDLDHNNEEKINPEQLAEYIFGFCKGQQRKYLYMNLMLN